MRLETRIVTALRRTPARRPTDWMLRHVAPGAAARRRNHAIDVETVHFIEANLPQGASAVDIGAHTGEILKEIVRICPNGSHHAVEPLPDLADGLRRKFPNVEIHECVLGSAELVASSGARATIHRNVDDPGYSSVARVDHPRVKGKRIEDVEVALTSLDALQLAPIALIKLDVEGFELEVLKGGLTLLGRDRPAIVFEHEWVGRPSADTAEIYALLDGLGYRLRRLVDWRSPTWMSSAEFESSHSGGDSYFVAVVRAP